MTRRPPTVHELTPAQREAFVARYGPVLAVAASDPTYHGVTLGPESPLIPKPKGPRGTPGKRQEREHAEQVAFFRAVDADPALRDLPCYAVPNGGHRHAAVAAKLRAEGVRKGVPDVNVDVARGGWFGLRLEFKVKPNRLSPEQARWIKTHTANGYRALVVWSAEEALRELRKYVGLAPTGR